MFYKLCSFLSFLKLHKQHEIITNNLNYKKVCSHWMFMNKYLECTLTFLTYGIIGKKGMKFLIIITHETKSYLNQNNSPYVGTISPSIAEIKQMISTRKIVCTIFFQWNMLLRLINKFCSTLYSCFSKSDYSRLF